MIITALIAVAFLASCYWGMKLLVWLLMYHEQKLLNAFLAFVVVVAFVITYGTVATLRRQLGL
jgi:hypothetical protein